MPSSLTLPIIGQATSDEEFRDALLNFACNSERWQILCGGIHMLDFLVRDPDLYDTVLPEEWRTWLEDVDIMDVIDLLNLEDPDPLENCATASTERNFWRGHDLPPVSMLQYLRDIKKLLLDRTFRDWEGRPRQSRVKPMSRQLRTGMNDKKCHEVEHFSAFVSDLCQEIAETTPYRITDVVDFGAGQGYLGRVLASSLYEMDVVSIESKPHNIDGARRNDYLADPSKRETTFRNKKLFKAGVSRDELRRLEDAQMQHAKALGLLSVNSVTDNQPTESTFGGTVRHIEHRITSGDLAPVIEVLKSAKSTPKTDGVSGSFVTKREPQLMIISLHSCGNLLHHGLRSIAANDSVKAVAMIGCCYNLCTERIGAPTFGLANMHLRTPNQRLFEASNACSADGFPMSEWFMNYQHRKGVGVRLNITASSMAVQAPRNWTRGACDDFFTRHWYRALLQRIFLEKDIIEIVDCRNMDDNDPLQYLGANGQPITIGKLPKHCYGSFVTYVREALAKLSSEEARGHLFQMLRRDLSDEEIADVESRFEHRRHQLCVMWSFMAFSAGLAEAMIVVDRWQWLREQENVSQAWVQSVFDYSQSPRNLVVVGLKK